jgi:hypothetical protein
MSDTAPVKSPPEQLTHPEEPSIGNLVATISRDVSSLVQHEVALVKSEVKVTVKNGGLGAALFAAAGFMLVLAVIMVSIAVAYFIHMTGLDLAWCFLIVFFLYVLLAGLLGFIGFTKVRQVGPPERSIAQAQETKKVLTNRG